MWWGGESAAGPAESGEEDTEVMEILSEEDLGPSTSAEAAPFDFEQEDEDDLGRLKERFQEQESLLGQLKGVLKSNERKLVTKEKEVQVCPMILY